MPEFKITLRNRSKNHLALAKKYQSVSKNVSKN